MKWRAEEKKRRVLSTNAWNSLTGDSLKCQAN